MIYRYLCKQRRFSTYVEVQESEYHYVPFWKTIKLLPITNYNPLDEAVEQAKSIIHRRKSLGFGEIIE